MTSKPLNESIGARTLCHVYAELGKNKAIEDLEVRLQFCCCRPRRRISFVKNWASSCAEVEMNREEDSINLLACRSSSQRPYRFGLWLLRAGTSDLPFK
jgi:hypothetical protein